MAPKLHTWENITEDPDAEYPIHRLTVPGGWLYKIRGNGFMTFVPVPPRPLVLSGPIISPYRSKKHRRTI